MWTTTFYFFKRWSPQTGFIGSYERPSESSKLRGGRPKSGQIAWLSIRFEEVLNHAFRKPEEVEHRYTPVSLQGHTAPATRTAERYPHYWLDPNHLRVLASPEKAIPKATVSLQALRSLVGSPEVAVDVYFCAHLCRICKLFTVVSPWLGGLSVTLQKVAQRGKSKQKFYIGKLTSAYWIFLN